MGSDQNYFGQSQNNICLLNWGNAIQVRFAQTTFIRPYKKTAWAAPF